MSKPTIRWKFSHDILAWLVSVPERSKETSLTLCVSMNGGPPHEQAIWHDVLAHEQGLGVILHWERSKVA